MSHLLHIKPFPPSWTTKAHSGQTTFSLLCILLLLIGSEELVDASSFCATPIMGGLRGVGCVKARADLVRDIVGLGCISLTAGWVETLGTYKEELL